MADRQTSMDEWMKKYEEQNEEDRELVGSGNFDERDTLKAERDVIYEGYFLEGSQSGIEGKYGKNTAVHLTGPEGEKLTLWVNGYEEEHFLSFLKKLEAKGTNLPVKIDFLRTQEQSKSGNTYNRLRVMLTAEGDDVQFELDSF